MHCRVFKNHWYFGQLLAIVQSTKLCQTFLASHFCLASRHVETVKTISYLVEYISLVGRQVSVGPEGRHHGDGVCICESRGEGVGETQLQVVLVE